MPDLLILYPAEYAVEYTALQNFAEYLGVAFPPSEVKNLALHYLHASGEDEHEQAFDKNNEATLSTLVTRVLKRHRITRSTKYGHYYDRYLILLQYLIDRLQRVNTDAVAIVPEVAHELETNYPRS